MPRLVLVLLALSLAVGCGCQSDRLVKPEPYNGSAAPPPVEADDCPDGT